MTTIKDIDKYMSTLFPASLSEEWDNDGVMLCRDCDTEVKKALICLEVTPEAIEKAVELGAGLIITHHPFIFNPIRRLTGIEYSAFEKLIGGGISVLSYHTRADKACGGVNDVLAECLALEKVEPVGEFLRVGELKKEMDFGEFEAHLKSELGCTYIRAYENNGRKIKRVAVCGGAGKDFLFNAAKIADAYVSSDFSHNTFLSAKDLGISIFDCGHYTTENPVTDRFYNLLKTEFPCVEFEIFDVKAPFVTI